MLAENPPSVAASTFGARASTSAQGPFPTWRSTPKPVSSVDSSRQVKLRFVESVAPALSAVGERVPKVVVVATLLGEESPFDW